MNLTKLNFIKNKDDCLLFCCSNYKTPIYKDINDVSSQFKTNLMSDQCYHYILSLADLSQTKIDLLSFLLLIIDILQIVDHKKLRKDLIMLRNDIEIKKNNFTTKSPQNNNDKETIECVNLFEYTIQIISFILSCTSACLREKGLKLRYENLFIQTIKITPLDYQKLPSFDQIYLENLFELSRIMLMKRGIEMAKNDDYKFKFDTILRKDSVKSKKSSLKIADSVEMKTISNKNKQIPLQSPIEETKVNTNELLLLKPEPKITKKEQEIETESKIFFTKKVENVEPPPQISPTAPFLNDQNPQNKYLNIIKNQNLNTKKNENESSETEDDDDDDDDDDGDDSDDETDDDTSSVESQDKFAIRFFRKIKNIFTKKSKQTAVIVNDKL
jgi:hypothetical protein